jgi:hypothetical protein
MPQALRRPSSTISASLVVGTCLRSVASAREIIVDGATNEDRSGYYRQ